MMQVESRQTGQDLRQAITALCQDARERHGIPSKLADDAAAIALRRFEAEFGSRIGARENVRISGYFYGIVRRKAIASRGPEYAGLRSRLLLESLAADLRDTGRSRREIFLEIACDFGAHVEPSVLRAFEESLCA